MTLKRIDSTYRGRPTHHYKLDGVRVPGVTTIIGDGLPKPALLPWGIRSVAEYAADHLDRLVEMQPMGREAIIGALKQSPYTDRDQAAKRGTEVHKLAESLIHGIEVDVPAELAGHVNSYVQYLDEWQPTPVMVEGVVGSRRWQYAGSFDAVIDLPDGRRLITDIKTSRSGIFPETILQLAAYRYAEFYLDGSGAEVPMESLNITGAQAIWVRADGYSCYELPADERAFKDWLHIAWTARWTKTAKTLVGDPVHPDTQVAS